MNYKINEIFYTLQGEGAHSGIPAVFVRFSGCNLHCPWCDTDFSDFTEMSAEQIVAEVKELYDIPNERRKMVVLTGGEPALQVDKELVDALHQAGFYICIETNGTRPLPEGIDWITCSPKEGTRPALKQVQEVKVVFTGMYDPEVWREQLSAEHWMLQFNKEGLEPFNVTDIVLMMEEKTAVENVEVSSKAYKQIINGQVVIIRDGKMFNALGAEL